MKMIIRNLKGMLLSAHEASIRRNPLQVGYQPGERIAAVVQGQRPGCAVWSATETKRPPRFLRATFRQNDLGQWPRGRARRVNQKGNTCYAFRKDCFFRETSDH